MINPAASLPEMMLSGIRYPITAIDRDNRFIFANPAAEEFFQASASLLAACQVEDFFVDVIPEMLNRARANRSSVSDQGIDLHSPKLGQKRINIQVSPLHDARETLVMAVQEMHLAERLRGQEQFRGAARSMELLSALLAHEIKNPLAGIRGAAELLADDPSGDPSALTGLIMAETDRIAALLTRVETLVGEEPPERKPVNIHAVLNHCIKVAKNSFGREAQLVTSFDPSLPQALGDHDLLVQCFINLIKNACEAIDKNNLIEIKSSFNLGARFAYASGGEGAACPLVVEITDHGSGIPSHLRDHIFDPFITGRPNGTGLGLAMVASAVSRHGGTIDVDTQPGRTSFRVGLPMSEIAMSEIAMSEMAMPEEKP